MLGLPFEPARVISVDVMRPYVGTTSSYKESVVKYAWGLAGPGFGMGGHHISSANE